MSAQGMSMKTVTDLYVSLSIIGTGSWRSKVSTNFAQAMNDSGSPIAYWGEHCELYTTIF
jgi:hypothetical protein